MKTKIILYVIILSITFFNASENIFCADIPTAAAKNSEALNNRANDTVEIFVNWFNYSPKIEDVIKTNDIQNILKNEFEINIKEDKIYKLNPAAQLIINGEISDYKIINSRISETGIALEKRIELLLNFLLKENTNNKTLFEQRNFYLDYSYKTLEYSNTAGKNDKEAVREFLTQSGKKIYHEINGYIKSNLDKLPKKKKSIELNEEQKKILENLLPPAEAQVGKPQIKFSFQLSDEEIRVRGNLSSSGEKSDKYNTIKFAGNSDIRANVKYANGNELSGALKLKGDKDDKSIDLDKINVKYKAEKYEFEAGNLSLLFSDVVFNNSIEGFILDYAIAPGNKNLKIFAGRDKEPKDFKNFLRYSAGLNYTEKLKNNQSLKFNIIYIDDKKNSIEYDSAAFQPGENLIISNNLKLNILKNLQSDFEFAYSFFTFDKAVSDTYITGFALSLNNTYKYKKAIFTGKYSRISPYYNSMSAVFTGDKEKIFFDANLKMSEQFNYKVSSEYQEDNLDREDDKKNFLFTHKFDAVEKPFSKDSLFKNVDFENGLEIRKDYNLVIKDNSRDKDLMNYIFKMKCNNAISRNVSVYALFEFEKERDNTDASSYFTRNYEFFNNIKTMLYKIVNVNFRSKYRYKVLSEKKETLLNSSISFNYSNEAVALSLDYYHDLNLTSIVNQDSAKKKIEFDVKFYPKVKITKNTVNFKLTYDINTFEDSELNYKKIAFFSSLKIDF